MKKPTYGIAEAMFQRPQLTESQRLVYDFCYAIRHGEEIDSSVLESVVVAFESYMTGDAKTLDEAFGVKRGRGAVRRRSLNEHARRVSIAAAVVVEKTCARKRKLLSHIFDELVPLLSEKPGFIQDCYEEHRKQAIVGLKFAAGEILTEEEAAELRATMKALGGAYLWHRPKNLPLK